MGMLQYYLDPRFPSLEVPEIPFLYIPGMYTKDI